jgi:hypothetical protein
MPHYGSVSGRIRYFLGWSDPGLLLQTFILVDIFLGQDPRLDLDMNE